MNWIFTTFIATVWALFSSIGFWLMWRKSTEWKAAFLSVLPQPRSPSATTIEWAQRAAKEKAAELEAMMLDKPFIPMSGHMRWWK